MREMRGLSDYDEEREVVLPGCKTFSQTPRLLQYSPTFMHCMKCVADSPVIPRGLDETWKLCIVARFNVHTAVWKINWQMSKTRRGVRFFVSH